MITSEQKKAWVTLSAAIHPPQNEAYYQKLAQELDDLLEETGGDEHHELAGLVDYLGEMVAKYEEAHHPIELSGVSAEQMLAFLMEQQGLVQKDLEREGFDSQGNISAILNGKRQMTKRHIEVACRVFSVPADVFF